MQRTDIVAKDMQNKKKKKILFVIIVLCIIIRLYKFPNNIEPEAKQTAEVETNYHVSVDEKLPAAVIHRPQWRNDDDKHTKIVFVNIPHTGAEIISDLLERKALKDRLNILRPVSKEGYFSLEVPFNKSQAVFYQSQTIHFISAPMIFNFTAVNELLSKEPHTIYVTMLRNIPDVFSDRTEKRNLHDILTWNDGWDEGERMDIWADNWQQAIEDCDNTKQRASDCRFMFSNWYYEFLAKANLDQIFGQDSRVTEKNLQEIQKIVDYLDRTFDVVLIAEMFYESLLLLNDHLNWPLEDLAVDESEVEILNQKSRNKQIQKRLWIDLTIYEHFMQKAKLLLKYLGQPEDISARVEQLKYRQNLQ